MFKIFCSLICALFCLTANCSVAATSEGLFVHNMDNDSILPRNFRTTKDSFPKHAPKNLSRKGFDQLNISGSAQFSEKSFSHMIDTLQQSNPIYILDFREEYHGFLNGAAVSWYAMRNWENVGKSLKEIEKTEKSLLKQSLAQKDVILKRIVFKDINDGEEYEAASIPFSIERVSTEKEMVKKYQAHYIRIPVTDHCLPADYSVDRFIEFVKKLPKKYWLHFHCAAGRGRTTTFMIMFDMMKNAKKLPFEEIVSRHHYIGGNNFLEKTEIEWKKKIIAIEKAPFLKKFYDYCRSNNDQFKTTWSLYRLQTSQ
jgi:predicted protein tyrosine phosphatase